VPTSPEAELPSPYWIFQVLPDAFLKVEDLDGSKTLCPEVEVSVSVEKHWYG
jgi:hypothetical protein